MRGLMVPAHPRPGVSRSRALPSPILDPRLSSTAGVIAIRAGSGPSRTRLLATQAVGRAHGQLLRLRSGPFLELIMIEINR